MPITPPASRPIGRTSPSENRASMPCDVAMITSSSPDETLTHASSSPSLIVIARIPVARTRSNCSSGVFLMIPLRVAMTRKCPGSKLGRQMVAIGTSPVSTWTPGRLMIAMPLAWRERVRDRVDLGREHAAAVGEEQRPVVGVRGEQVLDGVLLAGHVADDPLAAAVLAAVGRDRLALDVAAPADRDDDVLVGDQVLVGHLAARVVDDARPALAGVLALQLGQLVLDDREDARRVGEDVLELGDELDDREVLVLDLLALEGGEAGEPHVEDRLGLRLRQAEPRHQVRARRVDVVRAADRLDHRVEVVERDLEALEDVGPCARLLEVELGAPADDLAAVVGVVAAGRS